MCLSFDFYTLFQDENGESSEAKNAVLDFAKTTVNVPKYDSSKHSKQVSKDSHNRGTEKLFCMLLLTHLILQKEYIPCIVIGLRVIY